MNNNSLYSNREIIRITGQDALGYLQGVTTNNMLLLDSQNLIYSLILNSIGRVEIDFFVFKKESEIFLDISAQYSNTLLSILDRYKFIEDVNFEIYKDLYVCISDKDQEIEEKYFFYAQDPRNKELGYRAYYKTNDSDSSNIKSSYVSYDSYTQTRIEKKIIEPCYDIEPGLILPVEANLDNQWTISYKKKCYVGQEQVAKMHHKNIKNKEVIIIKLADEKQKFPQSKSIILLNEQKIGYLCSSYEQYALAIINVNMVNELKNNTYTLTIDNKSIAISCDQ